MSDFSELCPLFSTGVYNEVCLDFCSMSGLSATNNALVGALTAAKYPASFKFQRTVVVTKVYSQKRGVGSEAIILTIGRRAATGTAAKTAFASIAWSSTDTLFPVGRIRAMTQAANKTFLAADVLDISLKTTKTDAGQYGFIVRYKEK